MIQGQKLYGKKKEKEPAGIATALCLIFPSYSSLSSGWAAGAYPKPGCELHHERAVRNVDAVHSRITPATNQRIFPVFIDGFAG